jgi:hypothetical protein
MNAPKPQRRAARDGIHEAGKSERKRSRLPISWMRIEAFSFAAALRNAISDHQRASAVDPSGSV